VKMTSVAARGVRVVPDPTGPPPKHLKPLKGARRGKEETKKQEQQTFREELPYLTPVQTAEYRNPFFETLCTSILTDGFHRTFTEMLHLIKQQRRDREVAGPESMLWQITPLEEQPEKLKNLSRYLMAAENSERKGDHLAAYEAYLYLAHYFEEEPNDKWLSDHYYDRCLRSGPLVQGDGGRKLAEAHYNKGMAMERGGRLEEAMTHFAVFYDRTRGQDAWVQRDGKGLHRVACEALARVHISRSDQLPDEAARELLQKAHSIAKESGNTFLEARCAHHLGNVFDRIDKPDTALHFYKEFYQLASKLDDPEQLGLACEALATAYEKQGKAETSVKYLEEFAKVTEGKQDRLFSRACRGLGAAFNKQGEFQRAADYFSKAFSVARTLQDKEDIYLTRMQYGISQAFSFLSPYTEQLRAATPQSTRNLLTWKEVRKNDDLKKPLADRPPETLASRRPVNRRPPAHVLAAEEAERRRAAEAAAVEAAKAAEAAAAAKAAAPAAAVDKPGSGKKAS
ncbi:hypothetical protein BOX15_Mlig030719g1, partial [Macrostomum lignano]